MEKLGIDVKILLAQVLNFVILFVVFKKFLVKPFLETLDKEQAKRAQEEKKLKELEGKERELYNQKLNIEQEYEKKIKSFYAKMKKEADETKQQIIKEAKVEAEEIRKHNLELIKAEKDKGLLEVKKEAYKIALVMAEKAISEALDPDMQKKINLQIINKLSKKEYVSSGN